LRVTLVAVPAAGRDAVPDEVSIPVGQVGVAAIVIGNPE